MKEVFQNREDGIEATIAPYYKGGFSVAIKDTDADQYFPCSAVFATMEEAVDYAKKSVALGRDSRDVKAMGGDA